MISRRLLLVGAGAAIFFAADVHAQSTHITPQTAPSVVLTAPQANEVISESLTPTILLQATVSTADAPISQVIFYVCPSVGTSCTQPATIAATLTASPYEYAWTPPRTVSQTSLSLSFAIWATAVNALSQASSSAIVPITVIQPPPAPSISLVAPKNDSGFVTPASPVLYATASPGSTNPPSTLTMVEFFDGDTLIGSVSQPNATPSGYALTWFSAPVGIHLISARATDSLGYSTFSTPIVVYIIGPDPAPLVGLGSPATGQVFAPTEHDSALGDGEQCVGHHTARRIRRRGSCAGNNLLASLCGKLGEPAAGKLRRGRDGVRRHRRRRDFFGGVHPGAARATASGRRRDRACIGVHRAVRAAAAARGDRDRSGRATSAASISMRDRACWEAWPRLLINTRGRTQPRAPKPFWPKHSIFKATSASSAAVPVTIVGNAPPTVTLTSPTGGAQFTAPATIALAATATDSDGSVAKVEFFAGATKVGTATAAPFTASWSNVNAGSYTLTAVATDNIGATTTSAAVAISVSAPAPSVTLSTPQSGATFAVGQSILITAQASSPGQSIGRVEFYGDGALISGTNVAGAPAAINVNLSWNTATAGQHTLYAKVITTNQASAISPSVSISVSDLSVSITEPSSGQIYLAPAQVRIAASASSSGSQVSRIEFYGDEVAVGDCDCTALCAELERSR